MSLQVWLPLNGDLHNQGLANITATNNGATVDNNGKIGKCYRFGTAKSFLELPVEAMNDFTTECTVSFWLKILTRNTGWDTYFQAGLGGTAWNNYVFGFLRNNSNKCCFTVSGEAGTSSGSFVTSDMELDTWYHITLVYQTGHCLIYMDGMLYHDYSTAIVPAFNNITTITIGCANTKTNYQSNCLLNDLRIYDHALSPLEVKHLAQGLVLHYPLNRGGFGQDNLVNGLYAAGRTIVNNGIVTALLSQNLDCYFHFTCSEDLLAENDYTISMDVSGFSGADKYLVWGIINQNSGQTITMRNGKCFAIFSPSSNITAGTKIIIDDGNRTTSGLTDLTIRNIKVEHGSIPTPWIPNQADALYSQMGLDNNIEYDVSGYGNNGELYAYDANGSITVESDIPRYNVSTHIASANSTTNAASGTRYIYGHCSLTNPTEMTVSFWLKPVSGGYGGITSNGQGYFCTTNYEYGNANAGSDYQASAMNHRDGAVDINDSSSTTQCRPTFYPTIGEWHHYVITYDGQVGRVYKDGVQSSTAQFSSPKTLNSFIGVIIGFSKAGGVWRRNDACYSDFRIYATALSADDVMALYKNAGYVDSDGNVYAYEMTE